MMPDQIPGYDKLRQLSKEYQDPVVVTNVKPIDVSFIEDPGMRAVVTLATSLEWNMVRKPNRVLTLIARNGTKLGIPTDTSIKFSVFQNRVNATVTHSFTHIPTVELAEKIIKLHKLDHSHARVVREAVTKLAMADVPEPEVTEPGPGFFEGLEIPEPDEFVPTERVEPTLNTAAKGQQYVSQIMETVYRRLVEHGDEQVTYRCLVCGLEFPTKRGVGGHYGNHVTKGEAEAKPDARENIIKVVPTEVSKPDVREPTPEEIADAALWRRENFPGISEPEPEVEPPVERTFINNKPLVDELLELRRIVSEVGRLVGREHIEQLQERCQELTIERDEAVARANRLASDLRSLRELIGGLSDE